MLKCCVCLFCSPNSSTVVLASFCSASADFFHSNFGHPPNMVTCVHPGPKFKAVAVCLNRGCAPSGRVSWGEIRSWVLFWAHGKNPAIDLGSEPRTVWILASHSYHSKPLGHQRRERQATRAALPRGLPSLFFLAHYAQGYSVFTKYPSRSKHLCNCPTKIWCFDICSSTV